MVGAARGCTNESGDHTRVQWRRGKTDKMNDDDHPTRVHSPVLFVQPLLYIHTYFLEKEIEREGARGYGAHRMHCCTAIGLLRRSTAGMMYQGCIAGRPGLSMCHYMTPSTRLDRSPRCAIMAEEVYRWQEKIRFS